MRKEALDRVAKLVEEHPNVVFIGSDLGAGVLTEAMEQFPSRVLMEGIAEQHVVGMAAGLALEGLIPYVHTIGTFLTRRSFEQVAMDCALHQLPVRLLASGGGMVYAPLGPTHQAIEDFALMRAVPGMSIIAPIDPQEMEEALTALVEYPGPAYIRMGKGGESIVTEPGFAVGRARVLHQGSDVLLISTGVLGHECLTAAELLSAEGIAVQLVHVPCVAPLDEDFLLAQIARFRHVLVVEEHVPSGGLWTALVEVTMRNQISTSISQRALPSTYASSYGSQSDHWGLARLNAHGIAENVREMVKG